MPSNTSALKLHPDTHLPSLKSSGPDGSTNEPPGAKGANEEFIRVAEAWSVLSKVDLKQQYDLMRKGGGDSSHTISGPGCSSVVSSTYSTQKSAYHRSVKQKASSNWMELKDKYKSEKWQNLPLSQKKVRTAIEHAVNVLLDYFLPAIRLTVLYRSAGRGR